MAGIRKITIHYQRIPKEQGLNEELQWFCNSLGLFGNRDRDKSCFRMFIILLRSLNRRDGLTSDEISEKVGLSRGTVVHHLHTLMGAGLVVQDKSRYMLRVEDLKTLVDEVERDLLQTLEKLREVAENIDKRLEL